MSESGSRVRADAERTERIRQMIDDCIDRRSNSETIADADLITAHPDLMPELETHLRNLRLVEMAQTAAKHASTVGLHIRCPHCQTAIELVEQPSSSDLCCSSCGNPFSLTDESDRECQVYPDEMVNHFQPIERVGMGAFGSVWKAWDTQLDRTVALKIPRKGQMDPGHQEQFIREARIAAQLKHPSIVSVLEVGRHKDRIYIACDFVEGVDLANWLAEEHATPREAAELCLTVAEALRHAHERGVIHRDLKPSNIMLDEMDEPHLTDFGLAKRETAELTMTLDGRLLGTPAYMPPEQARGNAHDADSRSDIYSLGVILFEMLTGDRPFRGNVQMLIHQVLVEDAPSPRKLNHRVPKDLETICLKCLEKDPDRRYQTAGELRDDLQRFLSGQPVRARPITKIDATWRWCKRHPKLAVSLAIMTVLFASTIVAWMRAGVLTDQLRTSVLEAIIGDAYEVWRSGNLEQVDELLQSQIPASLREDRRGFEWYFLAALRNEIEPGIDAFTFDKMIVHATMDMNNRNAFVLLRNEELLRNDEIVHVDIANRHKKTVYSSTKNEAFEPQCLAASADGTRLAIGSEAVGPSPRGIGKVEVKTLSDGAQFEITTNADVRAVAISPDGMWVACVDAQGEVQVWNAATGKLNWKGHFVDRVPGRTILKFSPDGRLLACLEHRGYFALWDVSTASHRSIEDTGRLQRDFAFSPDGSTIAIAGEHLHLLDVVTFELYPPAYRKHLGYANAIAFSPDGKQLAIGTPGRAIRILDFKTTELVEEKRYRHPHREANHFLQYSADGNHIVSASHDALRVISNRPSKKSYQIGTNWGTPFAVDPTSSRIAFSARTPRTDVLIWDANKTEPFRLTGHDADVTSVAFSYDGKFVASGDQGGVIRIWNTTSRSLAHEITLETGYFGILTMGSSPVTDLLVAFHRGSMTGWEMSTGRELWTVKSHNAEDIVFTSDGRMFVAGSEGSWEDPGLVTEWKVDAEPRVLSRLPQQRFALALAHWQSPDGKRKLLAVSDRGSQIVLYDVSGTPSQRHVLKGHTHHAYSVEFDPTGRTLISSGHDGTTRMWSVATGRPVGTIHRHGFSIPKFLTTKTKGKLLAAECTDSSWLTIREIDTLELDEKWSRRVP